LLTVNVVSAEAGPRSLPRRGFAINLAPLTEAPVVIQLHACAALAALALGIFQVAAPKGTTRHRITGYAWVGLMLVVAVSSFWIHDLRLWGVWSPIHLLSIFTLTMLPLGVHYARHHNVTGHKRTMVSIFAGALVIAGIFTLAPGRIMSRIVFGG
jgi:uncharacterized membrane protein